MTTNVVSIAPDATILEALQLMLQRRISGLPVVAKGGRLVGILTEGDFLRRVETGTQRKRPRWLEFLVGPGRLADEYTHSHGRNVEEVMTSEPKTVTEDTPLLDVVQLMEKQQIKRVPVVRGQQIVGIISRANLLHALAGIAREIKPTIQSDESIRAHILAELGKQTWAPNALINVTVRTGVVELWGTVLDWRERTALVVAAENAPGVKAVNDHLVWIDTMTGTVIDAPVERPPAATAARPLRI
jgi:CBS domain-containing protein